MLVVVHNRDVESLLQALFDIETLWSLDILKVDTAKGRSNLLYSFAEFLRIFLCNFDIENVDTAIYLKEQSLALHNRLTAHSAYVAKTKHSGAVGDNGNKVALVGVFVNVVRVFLNSETWICHTR